MNKLWLVAQYEYKRHVFQRRFILILLSVPAIIALTVGLVGIMNLMGSDDRPVGYVDQVGLLVNPLPAPVKDEKDAIALLPFPDEQAARQALDTGEIQAYYVLPPDYFQTTRVSLVYNEEPSDKATQQFWDFMQINLAADQPYEVAYRLAVAKDNDLIKRLPDGSREFGAEPTLSDFLPLIISFVFIMMVFMTAGQLMTAVVEEKENRTIEIMFTSLSPGQMMGGKILGTAAIGLTQILAWFAFALLAAFIGGEYLGLEWLRDLHMAPQSILLLVGVLLPSYVLLAALMTAIGATIAEVQEGQQIAGLMTILFVAPLWIFPVIAGTPHGPVAIALSFIPFTAPMTMSVRTMVAAVPAWQIFTCVAVLVLCALGMIWLAGRAFRLGMLRYGQRLDWRQLFAKETPQP